MKSFLLKALSFVTQRAKEPSTYAGAAAVAAAVGYSVDPGTVQVIANFGVAASGLAAVFMKEVASA